MEKAITTSPEGGHSLTVMTDEEREAFLEMLANPPEPSEALVKLMNTSVTIDKVQD
jgi:uncharacterized protein (DUF1778 family)